MSEIFWALVVLVVLGVSGAPIVLASERGRSGLIETVFESLAVGLVVQLLVGFVALRSGHYSRPTVLVLTLVVIAGASVVALRRRRSAPHGDTPARTRARPLVPLLVLGGMVVVLGVAFAVRQGPSYFIFLTGDMGEYVNRANSLAAGGTLTASFPHGFTVFLAGTNLLLGASRTVDGVPALGVMMLLGAFAYARVARWHPIAALGIAALVAVHPVTVWFSLFPVSESLYAVLLIAALYFVARARANSSHSYAVVAGLVVGIMLLVRGNAMLLAPVVIAGLLASAAVDDERAARIQRTFSIVALISLGAAYAYDLHYPRAYFVQTQLHNMLPHTAFRIADRAQLFSVSIFLVIALAIGLAVVLRAAVLVNRFVRPRVADHPVVFWRWAYGVVVGVTSLALVFMHHAGLVDALARWGPVLVALMLVGVAVVVARPGRYLDGVDGWLLLLVICTYSLLFAGRVPASRGAAYYLYYDRYLFSEVLPAALVLAAIGLHFFVDGYLSAAKKRVVTRVSIIAVGVVAAVAFVPTLKETHRITKYPLFGDSYQTLHRLDELTRTEGNGAIVYSSAPTVPAGWFFHNTYRAFALPLGLTFKRTMVGMPTDPFGSDVQFDPAAARTRLQRAGFASGYLVSLRAPGATALADDAHTHFIGTVGYVCPTLGRTATRKPVAFQLIAMQFDVYALS